MVFEGLSWSPKGAEVACEAENDTYITAPGNLTAGAPYLIMFFTDGTSFTMVDPSISITAN